MDEKIEVQDTLIDPMHALYSWMSIGGDPSYYVTQTVSTEQLERCLWAMQEFEEYVEQWCRNSVYVQPSMSNGDWLLYVSSEDQPTIERLLSKLKATTVYAEATATEYKEMKQWLAARLRDAPRNIRNQLAPQGYMPSWDNGSRYRIRASIDDDALAVEFKLTFVGRPELAA